jgi:hypothetical protein
MMDSVCHDTCTLLGRLAATALTQAASTRSPVRMMCVCVCVCNQPTKPWD